MYQISCIKDDLERFHSSLEEGSPFSLRSVKIKLTWNCNLSCLMCNSRRQSRGTELTHKRVLNLIQEISELGCRKIHLSGGEPLLWEGLFDIADYARSRKHMKVNITTNGTLVTKETAKRLLQARLKTVSISLDSPDPAVHDTIRGEGNWHRTIEGVKNLVKERESTGSSTKIRFNLVVNKLNYRSLVRLPEIASELGVDFILLIPVDDHLSLDLKLDFFQLIEYNTEIAPLLLEEGKKHNLWEWEDQVFPFGKTFSDLEYSSKGLYSRGIYRQIPCFAPWLHSFISPRGRVFLCCMTKNVGALGKIKKKNFSDIWSGENYRLVRQKMLETRFSECFRCDSFLRENVQITKYLLPLSFA